MCKDVFFAKFEENACKATPVLSFSFEGRK